MPPALHRRLVELLRTLQGPDGGFPTSGAVASEVEPTTVAALALGDRRSRAWLAGRQPRSGALVELDGRPNGPTTAALAALVLSRGAARRALDYAISRRGLPLPNAADLEKRVAWGWTPDARSLVEPTARVLLAVNALAPSRAAVRNEALGFLRERQCSDGGWNFGNASVYDVDLRSYPQTTASALIALQGAPTALVAPALRYLRDAWRLEPGGLTIAQTILAFRLHSLDEALPPLLEALDASLARASFRGRALAVGWGALATGPESLLEPLRSRA